MPYVGNTNADRETMLSALGMASTDDLFTDIPERNRFPDLDLPRSLSEMEVLAELADLSSHNATSLSFAGAGAYHHFIPSVVAQLSGRGEFATAYTPYQAEASQGTLQAIFEYQSMLCDLLDMDVVNASHYDGATALAEAALMAVRATRGRSRVLFAGTIHPHALAVARSYLDPQEITMEVVSPQDRPDAAGLDLDALIAKIDSDTAAVVVANPDFTGAIHDLSGFADRVHETGSLLVLNTDPIACALFHSPGSLGADIVTGEGQPLGIPVSFGGPYLGIFATRTGLVRKLPGRLVGQTSDADGRRGFVLTLNTREQHIRREKATSNICTNQGLMALRAAIYLAAMGPAGLREIAERCYHNSQYAAAQLAALPGCSLNPSQGSPGDAPNPRAASSPVIFREFIIRTPGNAATLVRRAAKAGVVPGVPLSDFYPERTHDLLVAVTETAGRRSIDRLVQSVADALEAGNE